MFSFMNQRVLCLSIPRKRVMQDKETWSCRAIESSYTPSSNLFGSLVLRHVQYLPFPFWIRVCIRDGLRLLRHDATASRMCIARLGLKKIFRSTPVLFILLSDSVVIKLYPSHATRAFCLLNQDWMYTSTVSVQQTCLTSEYSWILRVHYSGVPKKFTTIINHERYLRWIGCRGPT